MLKEINGQLETLYRAYEDGGSVGIWTHTYLDGEPMNFRFYQVDSKYSVLSTTSAFSEWMAWTTGDWKKAAPAIEVLSEPYGVKWDNEKGVLYLKFRRNEISIAQAVMRLQQALSVICALGSL